MGVVAELFTWPSISPGETVGLFIHGYGTSDFAAYSIVPALHSNEPPGAETVQAQLTYGLTGVHVDGTIARTIYVQNQTIGPQPYISVDVLEFKQQVGS